MWARASVEVGHDDGQAPEARRVGLGRLHDLHDRRPQPAEALAALTGLPDALQRQTGAIESGDGPVEVRGRDHHVVDRRSPRWGARSPLG